ncbi:MAG: hypothetical protein RIA09_15760 [Hoeflea sp.]|jgi:hypothetical protein|uniref:hypothetical protein n=1 Tax=Hoeflea sp. TaxID=1940281 RepID=UPI0032F08A4F
MAALNFVERSIIAVADGSAYLNEIFPSPTGKYILRGTLNGVPSVAIRNDATGNYDTATSWVGAPAVSISSIAWAADESKVYIGAANGSIYIATVDTGTDTFTYVGAFASGLGEVRGISVSAKNPNHIAAGGTAVVVANFLVSGATGTLQTSRSMVNTIEDVKFDHDGDFLVAVDRNGNKDFFSATDTSISFLQRITGLGNWHAEWHPNDDHVAFANYLTAGGVSIIKKTGSTFAEIPSGSAFPGGAPAAQGIALTYISHGKYLFFQDLAGSTYKLYERDIDTYIDRTADVVGYTPIASYEGNRNSNDGTVVAFGGAAGGAAASKVYSTPVVVAGIDAESEMELSAFTFAAEVDNRINVNSANSLEALEIAGELDVGFGAISAASLSAFKGAAFVAAADEDIITLQPIVMAPASAFVYTVDPIIGINNDPDPFTYGFLELPTFTADAFVRHPLEVRASELILSGFTTDGMIEWDLVPEPIEVSLQAFQLEGVLQVDASQVEGEGILSPLEGDGEITVPFGGSGAAITPGFEADGSIRFGFKTTGEAILPQLQSSSLLFIPITATGEADLPTFELDGEGEKDTRKVEESEAVLVGLSADGEIDVEFGFISAADLPGFTAEGLLEVPMVIRSEAVLPGLQAEVFIDRPTLVDANFSLYPFVTDVIVTTPLENTAQMQLQAFEMESEAKFGLSLDEALVLPGMEAYARVNLEKKKITSTMILPQMSAEASAKFGYRVTSAFDLPGFQSESEVTPVLNVESAMALQGLQTSATLRAVMFRRQVRIIQDTFTTN